MRVTEDMTTTPPQRVEAGFLADALWLLVALLSASLALLLYVMALIHRKRSRRLADRKPVIYCYGAILYAAAVMVLYPVVDNRILQAQTLRAEALHYLAAGGVTGG